MPFIRTKVELDREDIASHRLVVLVSNLEELPPGQQPVPPESVDPTDPDDRSYLVVNIDVGDEKDTPPEFVQAGIVSGGISQSNFLGDLVSKIEIRDLDLEDRIQFAITSV
jgi:hypothetical protein